MPESRPIVIGAEHFLRAQREANTLATDEPAVQLRAIGVDPAAAIREAAIVLDTYEAYGFDDSRSAIVAAFLGGLELGVRCARLTS